MHDVVLTNKINAEYILLLLLGRLQQSHNAYILQFLLLTLSQTMRNDLQRVILSRLTIMLSSQLAEIRVYFIGSQVIYSINISIRSGLMPGINYFNLATRIYSD